MQGFGLKDLHGPVRRADVGDVGRCGLMWADVGRCGQMWADVG